MTTSDTAMIEVEEVTKHFESNGGPVVALGGVSLTVPAGQWLALTGHSGSGKSTLLHLIAGLDRPTSGRIVVEGQDVGRLSQRRMTLFRRRRIGFVFQFFHLVPTLSVFENVMLPLHLNGVSQRRATILATQMLHDVGLGDRAQDAIDQLSGGQQQRVAIARAVVHTPAVLLADEPTGTLDSATGREILELLRRLQRDRGCTIVMATHNPEAALAADRTIQLRDGRLIADELTPRRPPKPPAPEAVSIQEFFFPGNPSMN